jgi:hypothetical protein
MERRLIKYLRVNRRERGGGPRLRWQKDVEKDLWELKVKRWRQQGVYREEWASVIKEAKALRGPYSQGISHIPRKYTK